MVEQENNHPGAEFKFRYQKDSGFQTLIDVGIGNELSDSGYCWAACIDMALSPFVLDELRSQIIVNSVKHEKLANGGFNSRGELNTNKLVDFVDVINESLINQKLSPRLNLIINQKFDDYHLELQKGRSVIFGIANDIGGHMMVMEKVYQDGGKYIYSVWDPGTPNLIEANIYFDNFQLYGRQQYADTKLLPFIISVGEDSK